MFAIRPLGSCASDWVIKYTQAHRYSPEPVGEPKVRNEQGAFLGNHTERLYLPQKQVLRLQIAMRDPNRVASLHTIDELPEICLRMCE